ncbi:spore coat polysaccharide biosynthesis protein SpsC [Desulfoluna limicola]|uniref:Spore coat polysaccharide biosynthesis protein SpsC n=1 Tax=Desulfoluna limicola TaxID=2810562 RepID=A0ABM7PC39_9BACT|nr:DegT/DnrJ/EryC1/StrS family aminotransferase [Desulfoluna limicola]BCS94670.1 spore coat polysaccharide biosynthesis protein SpsC [Desulfoluna limicola]
MNKWVKRSKKDFLVFGSPLIEQAEIDEVVSCMQSAWLGTGPKVAKFEEDFRAYKKADHAVAVNSCTAALHLSILVTGIEPGDEVITTPLTFCATVNAIIHAGGTPVLADVDPLTMNIDPVEVEKKITPRTKAIIPVHFAGRPCRMDALCAIAHQNDLVLIEDCAHAIETEYHGRKAGTFGDLGCFSFYTTKNIVTGEGGMILSNKKEYADRLKILALHGMSSDAWQRFSDEGYKHYMVTEPGFKYNMMDLQAAIGIHQLTRIDHYWQRRQEIWNAYNNLLRKLPVTTPPEPEPDTRHAYHLYPILIDEKKAGISRDAFLSAMNNQNIGTGVHYLSLPEHPYYRKTFGWVPQDYPHAMRIGRQTVSLPLSAKLSNEDIEDVVIAIRSSIDSKKHRPKKQF